HGLGDLKELIDVHSNTKKDPPIPPPLSLFGHADPVGDEEYNKKLSGQRAQAMYALLVPPVDMWQTLYTEGKWGDASVQVMLNFLGFEAGTPNGVVGSQTKSALKEFQKKQSLSVTEKNDAATRKRLFEVYMDAVCIDNFGNSYKLDP